MADCDIVVVGGLARRHITEADEVPRPGETIETTKPFTSHTGGRGAFTAVAAHRLSHMKPQEGSHVGVESAFSNLKIHVHLVATVGDDETGDRLRKRMSECGVNADHVQKIKGISSSRVIVIIDRKTKDLRIWFDAAANHVLKPDAFRPRGSLNNFAGGRKPVLLVTNLELESGTTKQLITTAATDDIEVLLNPVPSHLLSPHVFERVAHLVYPKAEVRRSYDDCPTDNDDPSAWAAKAQLFLQKGAKNVVITLGAQGAYYANKYGATGVVQSDGPREINGIVGGGETFIGAYAAEYVKQNSLRQGSEKGRWDIKAAVQRGCKAANYIVHHEGCIYPLPWANEINR